MNKQHTKLKDPHDFEQRKVPFHNDMKLLEPNKNTQNRIFGSTHQTHSETQHNGKAYGKYIFQTAERKIH